MKKIIFLFICLSMNCFAFSQQQGNLHLVQDSKIDSLVNLHRKIRQRDSKIDGFRVQIFMESGNEAVDRAQKVSDEFLHVFPEIQPYISFGQPYYRIRVGNFRDRLEAEGYLKRIQTKYPQAFVISDRIELPKLASFSENIEDEILFEENSLEQTNETPSIYDFIEIE
ncbi:MAG: SPOR domain-containing protein [Lentimicrobiaceae bacterium]|jgi:hypothetical protein|nr:SPOR domain-containing protein [Lentimicrobiaceae bacterium]